MPNEESGFRGISLKKELVDSIENFINKHSNEGYKSVAEFVSEAVRFRIHELKRLHASTSQDKGA